VIKSRYSDYGWGHGYHFKIELDTLQELYPKRFDYIKTEELEDLHDEFISEEINGLTVKYTIIKHHKIYIKKI